MAVGRISGPLLKDNLLRNGVNLAFETSLLYLDVVNGRVGINTTTPGYDLSVNGTTKTTNLDITGNITIGDFTISGNTISSSSGIINLSVPTGSQVIYQSKFSAGSVSVTGNTVSTSGSNTNLQINPSGTGTVEISSSTNITGSLHATGNLTVDNSLFVGTLLSVNKTTSTISSTATNFNITSTNGVNISNAGRTTFIDGSTVRTGNLNLSGNTLSSLAGDITVTAFSGRVNFNNNLNISGNLEVTGDVTIGGNINIGDQTTDTVSFLAEVNSDIVPNANNTHNLGSSSLAWKTFYTNQSYIGDVYINGSTITTTGTDENLILQGNALGSVQIETLYFTGNTIYTQNNTDITLTPNGTGLVVIDSNQSLRLPAGNIATRPTGQTGQVRYNTELGGYEGYQGSQWIRIDGLYDVSRTTYVTAEESPGTNDGTFRFYSNNNLIADLDALRLNVIKANIGNLSLFGNTIRTTSANTDINLLTTGTGNVVQGNFKFSSNDITNFVPDSVTTITQTGTGYFKIAGTNGVVLPIGSSAERPNVVEVGMTRFNTDDVRVEVWSGTQWISPYGTNAGVTLQDATDLSIKYALMLG
jgi:hypothetical protein